MLGVSCGRSYTLLGVSMRNGVQPQTVNKEKKETEKTKLVLLVQKMKTLSLYKIK